jgi:hypothetical protein
MFCNRVSITAAIFLSAALVTASAQSPPATPDAPAPKVSKLKMTRDKLREMRAKWKANKPKLKACRGEARKQGLAGDDRWFFIGDCMDKV